MKYIVLCLALIAVYQLPTDAFLVSISGIVGAITDTVGNVVTTVTDTVTGVVTTVTDTINTAVLVGQFLWDNAVSPSLQVLQDNTLDFIDNYFGNILNAIGKRNVDRLQIEAQKSFVKELYLTETTLLISQLKTIFLNFFQELKSALESSLLSIALGQVKVKDIITQLAYKAIEEIKVLVNQTIQNIVNPLSQMKVLDSLTNFLSGAVSAIGDVLVSGLNVVLSSLVAAIMG